jgi:AcrR family transcriptional regulator
MPRSADLNSALRAATRDRLLRSALVLFARDGYAGTSVRAIAQQAGVATGLLYSHFSGKEALLRALFELSMADVNASFADALSERNPHDRLRALVQGGVDTVRRHLEFWQLSYAARSQPAVLAALGPSLGEWTASILVVLRGILVEAGSDAPETDAHALFAQIDGMCQHLAMDPAGYPADAVAHRIVARWARPIS